MRVGAPKINSYRSPTYSLRIRAPRRHSGANFHKPVVAKHPKSSLGNMNKRNRAAVFGRVRIGLPVPGRSYLMDKNYRNIVGVPRHGVYPSPDGPVAVESVDHQKTDIVAKIVGGAFGIRTQDNRRAKPAEIPQQFAPLLQCPGTDQHFFKLVVHRIISVRIV